MTDYTEAQTRDVQRDLTYLTGANDDGSRTVLVGGDTADAVVTAFPWIGRSDGLSIRHTYGLRTMSGPSAWLWAGTLCAGQLHAGSNLTEAILSTIPTTGR